MVNVAKRVIVLSISVLHLALVLTSSAGSVTCVDSDGVVKIEAYCKQVCVCEGRSDAATAYETHEHDDCGDCTDFFLSTFLQVSNHSSRPNSNAGPTGTNTAEQAWSGPGLADLTLR